MDPDLARFTAQLGVAVLLGGAIGLERQYRQHPAGLRTNTLVCVGAALFVSLTRLMGNVNNPTQMASYVVSGIGFLGGGVILRDGLTVKGMNTAATLWCTAAVGVLSGSGFPGHALIGATTVVGLHLALRPVSRLIDARLQASTNVDTNYRIRVVCQSKQKAVVRAILLRHVNGHPKMTGQGLSTRHAKRSGKVEIVFKIFSTERDDRAIEELMSRLTIEPSVTSVSWEQVQETGA